LACDIPDMQFTRQRPCRGVIVRVPSGHRGRRHSSAVCSVVHACSLVHAYHLFSHTAMLQRSSPTLFLLLCTTVRPERQQHSYLHVRFAVPPALPAGEHGAARGLCQLLCARAAFARRVNPPFGW
jgi:hypothetical protein